MSARVPPYSPRQGGQWEACSSPLGMEGRGGKGPAAGFKPLPVVQSLFLFFIQQGSGSVSLSISCSTRHSTCELSLSNALLSSPPPSPSLAWKFCYGILCGLSTSQVSPGQSCRATIVIVLKYLTETSPSAETQRMVPISGRRLIS